MTEEMKDLNLFLKIFSKKKKDTIGIKEDETKEIIFAEKSKF